MKAIIVLFEGQIGPNQEQDMISRIFENVFNHTTASAEQITICLADDKDVMGALVKHATSTSTTTKEKEDPIKNYCKKVIEVVGSPALASKDVYRNHFLSCIQKYESLRNIEVLRKIERNGIATSQILRSYGLECLVSYIPSIRAIFKVFDYGEI